MLFEALNTDYDVHNCLVNVGQEMVIESCGCYMPVDRRFLSDNVLSRKDIKMCTPAQMNDCATDKLDDAKKS